MPRLHPPPRRTSGKTDEVSNSSNSIHHHFSRKTGCRIHQPAHFGADVVQPFFVRQELCETFHDEEVESESGILQLQNLGRQREEKRGKVPSHSVTPPHRSARPEGCSRRRGSLAKPTKGAKEREPIRRPDAQRLEESFCRISRFFLRSLRSLRETLPGFHDL